VPRRPGIVFVYLKACQPNIGQNGGHLQPLVFDRTPDIAAFELKNCQEVASYIKSQNIDCEYRSVTGCRTFWTEPLLTEAIDAVNELKRTHPNIGQHVTIITSRGELKKHRVKQSCPGATLTTGAASLWPYKYVSHILTSLIKSEALNLQTNTPVTQIHPTTTSSQNPRGARYRVLTTRGEIAARHILLATNGHTSYLLPSFSDLLVPCRGTMTALLPPPGSTLLPNSYGFIGLGPRANPNYDDYLIQRPLPAVLSTKGHLMFGGGRSSGVYESIGESDDSVVDKGSVKYLRRILLDALDLGGDADGLKQLEAEYAWSGIMCYSRDNAPWVGRVPDTEGLWLCAGYTGHGMPNATLCAKAVVGMMGAEERWELFEFQKSLVEKGDLPNAYIISKARIEACRRLPSVKEQDESGVFGLRRVMDSEKANL
jgi:glycine/D-amino acid oxidase-like deaminating enzyme